MSLAQFGVAVPGAAAADRLARPAGLRVAEAAAARDRRPVGLGDDLVLRGAVAGVVHRLADAAERVAHVGGLGLLARGGEARGHRGVVAAVVLQPRRRRQPVGHAALDDRGEAVVVGADHHHDRVHVVRLRVVLQRERLALAAGAVGVEVDAGLEVLAGAGAAGRRLRARAGEVEARDVADVRLRGPRAVAAADRLAGRRVPVRARAQRVDARGGLVRVAGPAAALAGDGGVAQRDDGGRAHPGVGGGRWRQPEDHRSHDQHRPHDRPHRSPSCSWRDPTALRPARAAVRARCRCASAPRRA